MQALAQGRNKRVRKLMARLHPAKVAALIERLDDEGRHALWQQVAAEREASILQHLAVGLRERLVGQSAADALSEPPGPAHDEPARPAKRKHASSHLQDVREALGDGRLKRVGKLLLVVL